MNPCTWLAAGGANAGGGGIRAGKRGKGKAGANGDSGDADPDDGGKSAGACGSGTGGDGGCPNPQHGAKGKTSAGDPVDIASGRVFTVPAVDLALGGPLPLILRRSYSTSAIKRDVGLGPGWSHTFCWELELARRELRLYSSAGGIRVTDPLAVGANVTLDAGHLARFEWGFALTSTDGLTRVFAPNHSQDRRYRLTAVSDRNGNVISLGYDAKGALERITDSVGRIVRVRRHSDGHIASFEAPASAALLTHVAFRRYEYSADGDLVAAIDAAGAATTFAYEDHLLVRSQRPCGLTVYYRYDRRARCVETWAAYPSGVDESLDADVPPLLADGVTLARGVHHCKFDFVDDEFTEVIDSRQARRYLSNPHGKADKVCWGAGVFTNAFDDLGNLTAHQNAEEHVWKWSFDDAGRLLRTEDPVGAQLDYSWHPSGEVARILGPGGSQTHYERDAAGNLLSVYDQSGQVVNYEYNARGQTVTAMSSDGGVTRFEYDDLGNRTTIVEPDGGVRRIAYDYFGRPVSHLDARGGETRYEYDACGRIVRVQAADGSVTQTDYDAQGRVVRSIDTSGASITFQYAGLDRAIRVGRADGSEVRYRYDREGALVRIINESGEEQRLVRNPAGHIVEEHTFDGRVVRYTLDMNGEVQRVKVADTLCDIERDGIGRVTRKEHDSDFEAFDFDTEDRLIRARTTDTEVVYGYDATGNLIQEDVHAGGRSYALQGQYDSAGQRTAVTSTAVGGLSAAVHYDIARRPKRIALDGGEAIELNFDAAGNELGRRFSGGGSVVREYDVTGTLGSLRVLGNSAPQDVLSWPARGSGELWRRTYQYTKSGDLAVLSEPDGQTQFEYDVNGRLTRLTRDTDKSETNLRYDATGNLFDDVKREYGPGGRLLRYGDAIYSYDKAGRVIEKRRQVDGETASVLRFEWARAGLIGAIQDEAGNRTEFTHDAFGRCLLEKSFNQGQIAQERVFFWDSDRLLRERSERPQPDGSTQIEERSYAFLPSTLEPLAERRRRLVEQGGSVNILDDSGWLHHVTGYDGSPNLLVSSAGAIVERVQLTPLGALASGTESSTRLRRIGQYAGPHGLSYNRFRLYDPEAGIFLSPEPLGIAASLKVYAYADNYPQRIVDPDGLEGKMHSEVASTNPKSGKKAKPAQGISGESNDLHPAVVAALPPSSARENAGAQPQPRACAEPAALSQHIRNWEKRTGNSCKPGDANWQENLKSALGEVDGISSKDKTGDAASCPNCSQTIPRLYALAGMDPPNGKIKPGRDMSGPTKKATRDQSKEYPTSLPTDAFANNQANKLANTTGLTPSQAAAVQGQDLGIWKHDDESGFSRT